MGENAVSLKDMAAQLAAVLRVHGEKGREAWSQLHGKLAEVAAMAGNDPTMSVQALLKVAKDASSPQALEEIVSNVNPGQLKDLVRLVAGELNITPLGDSEPVHMVDEESNFCEANVDNIIKGSAELSSPDAPYAVVSIVGVQSSGKSYLLNRLFGTRFPEMEAKLGWRQTTRGIMMSRCIEPSLLLLDVEGFDGRENENRLFENQAALFALTVSDLMIVNMNIVDIGREEGGGSLIFRTIFQERSKIDGAGVTKILVVLRNYNGETPLEILRSDVLITLQKTWESVNGKSMKFKAYIEVNTFGMPDKESPKFPKAVTTLRELLSENRNAKVPASSFMASSKKFWENIKENKKLDIPTHQELLASSYCQRLVEDTLKSMDTLEDYTLLKAEILKDEPSPSYFRITSDLISETIKTRYDIETKMYDRDVRDTERQKMVKELYKIFTNHAKEIMQKTKEKTSKQFKEEFDSNIEKQKGVIEDYGKLKVQEYLNKFTESCEDLKVFDSVYLQMIYGKLKEHIEAHTALCTQDIKAQLHKKAEEIRNRPAIMKLGSCLLGLVYPTD